MGGIALGKAVVSSGLLETMDVVIREMVDGLSMYSVVLLLSFIVLVGGSYDPTLLVFSSFARLGCLHVHQPYNRQRFAGADRQGSGH